MNCPFCNSTQTSVISVENINLFSKKRVYGCNSCEKKFETIEDMFHTGNPKEIGRYLIKYPNGNFEVAKFLDLTKPYFEVISHFHAQILYVNSDEVEWKKIGE